MKLNPLLILFVFLPSLVVADTWTDVTGGFKVEAKFVRIDNQTVVLERSDGQGQIQVPISKLSQASQLLAKRLAAETTIFLSQAQVQAATKAPSASKLYPTVSTTLTATEFKNLSKEERAALLGKAMEVTGFIREYNRSSDGTWNVKLADAVGDIESPLISLKMSGKMPWLAAPVNSKVAVRFTTREKFGIIFSMDGVFSSVDTSGIAKYSVAEFGKAMQAPKNALFYKLRYRQAIVYGEVAEVSPSFESDGILKLGVNGRAVIDVWTMSSPAYKKGEPNPFGHLKKGDRAVVVAKLIKFRTTQLEAPLLMNPPLPAE